jgi:tRNA modification GTPase
VPSLLPGEEDTIVALATAAGRSAIAVVRLSGRSAFPIAERLVRPWPLAPRVSVLCRVLDPEDGSLIDRLVVSCFPGPRSYTGEDIVEFSSHGGHAVPEALLSAVLRAGARQADAGEFTRRAVLNGKLDLVQAEAIGDLIDASSDSMRRLVLHQLDGGLSRQIDALRDQLLNVEALLAYDIDFPEEDHGPLSRERVTSAAEAVLTSLNALLDTAPATELVREGAIVVIAGRPNVGKSSLFNALIGEARAIVTDIPGTTRDAIEARAQFNEWPVRIIDTAGLRATDEVVERLGIEVSERYLANAHAVIVCDDDALSLPQSVASVQTLTSAPIVAVLTKSDRAPEAGTAAIDVAELGKVNCPVRVSAHTRVGIPGITSSIAHVLRARYGAIPVARPALTRVRQRLAVEKARAELAEFQALWAAEALPATIAAVHVRAAVGALDDVIGAIDTEDILGRLFSTFCIGK